MSAPRRDFAKCCGVQDHPLCKTCDRFLRPPDAVSQVWAIPRPFEHVEQDGSVRRGCRDYVEDSRFTPAHITLLNALVKGAHQ